MTTITQPTTRRKPEAARSVRVLLTPTDRRPGIVRITITRGGQTEVTDYYVREVADGFGRGFELTHALPRPGRAAETYRVCVDHRCGGMTHGCSCPDAKYRPGGEPCKHPLALLALIRDGRLPVVSASERHSAGVAA